MSRDGWVIIKDTPTHVRTWGGWIEDKITSDSLIVCITGNPGVTGFYSVFLSTLHDETGIPVWVINHAGLEIPPDGECCMERIPSPKSTPHLLDLQGQIDHKLEFIKRYAGADDLKLYLVGHSAGAKMLTGLLDRERSLLPRVSHAYFLFPTLEHIAKSPYGKLHVNYGKYFLPITLFLTWVLIFLFN